MSARQRVTTLAFGLALAATVVSAQAPMPPPAPTPTPDPGADERRRQAVQQTFERALAEHLTAEQGGPEAEAHLRRAVGGYRKVLSVRPAAAAFYNLGRAEEALGELESAEIAFRNAAGRESSDRAFYLEAWAEYLERRGREADAESVWEELVLLEPRHDRSYSRVRDRLLAGEQSAEPLLDFLWKLVAAKQRDRAADLALTALEKGSSPYRDPELLTVVAASLVDRAQSAEGLRGSDVDRRLELLTARPEIGRGVAELRSLYLEPGRYDKPFPWWNRPGLEWADFRGVPRRDAFRALMRAIGDVYRSGGSTEIAAACYEGAAEFGDDPDPVALRRLATVYIESNQLDRLNTLAAKHADPSSRLFAGKNLAYAEGKLEKVLLYHRTLGQIYGSLALAGKGSWGNRGNYASAMFQLERAYEVARMLDRDTGPPKDGGATRVDADLTLLYAKGLEATGSAEQGNKVRLDAAQTFVAAGDGRSAGKVLQGIDERKLAAPDARRYEEYRRVVPNAKAFTPGGYKEESVPSAGDAAKAAVAISADDAAKQAYVGPAAQQSDKRSGALSARTAAAAERASVAAADRGPRALELPANVEWFDTGIALTQGQHISIRASGRWTNKGSPDQGPLGYAGYVHPGTIVANAALASLVARVGDQSFAVGESFDGRSPGTGNLFLAINDVPGTFDDNSGSLQVTIDPR